MVPPAKIMELGEILCRILNVPPTSDYRPQGYCTPRWGDDEGPNFWPAFKDLLNDPYVSRGSSWDPRNGLLVRLEEVPLVSSKTMSVVTERLEMMESEGGLEAMQR